MATIEELKSVATSMPVRAFLLALGISGLVVLGPSISVSLLYPQVWFDAVVSGYFLLACAVACLNFFIRRIGLLFFVLPGIAYVVIAGLWGLSRAVP